MVELLTLPFMQRALIGGILIASLTSIIGILAVLKKASFFGDTIAHASLAGVALGLYLGVEPLITAGILVVIIALFLPKLEEKSALPFDNLLGFILPFSMAIGVLLLAQIPGYQPDLISFLFGNILTISWNSLWVIGLLGGFIFIVFFFYKKQMILTIFDKEQARISNINVSMMSTLYSVFLALTIVLSIKLVGIILVNALLVIPATTARMRTRSLAQMFLLTPILSLISTIAGLFSSYFLNLPSGPTITVFAGIILLITALTNKR